MPIPQENSLFVERASSPLLTLVQDVSWIGFFNRRERRGRREERDEEYLFCCLSN